jgi:hypothetical protein
MWRYDQDGWSALLAACAGGHLDVARWLVTHAGCDARSERGEVSCRWCCGSSVAPGVTTLALGVWCDQNGWSALLAACANGHLGVARWLVTRSERDAVSWPLLCSRAAAAGLYRRLASCECERLVGCGAFPRQPAPPPLSSQAGEKALALACRGRHWSVARWLIAEQDVELVRVGVAAASSVSSVSEC